MNKKMIKDAAKAYAIKQLGPEQAKNKLAIGSIAKDFQDGAQWALEHLEDTISAAKQWNALEEKLNAEAYTADPEGGEEDIENPECDLIRIGEIAAEAFGLD